MTDITIKKDGITITLDLGQLAENLSADDKRALAQVLCWDELLNEAKARLAGSSEAWSSCDKELSFDFLKTQIIDQALALRFGAYSRAHDALRDMGFDSRLYWKLYHSDDVVYDRSGNQLRVGSWFSNWSRANGFNDSNYCDKEAKEWAEDIIARVEALLRADIASLATPAPEAA